jgi:hypothetical protein
MPSPENVPEQHRHRLRQFYRLLLSYGDFKHAKLIAQRVLDDRLHEEYPGESTTLLQALNCSMVMAYSRPFSGNGGTRGTSIPDLPARFLELLTPEERAIHDVVMFDRHKYMAHTDADAAALEPMRLQIDEAREVIIPVVVDRLAPLDEAATKLLLSAATKLLKGVVEERHAQEPEFIKYFRVASPETLFDEPK